MRRRHQPVLAGLLSLLAAVVLAGCDVNQIGSQARSSLSSFVTGVVNNAINDVINGNN